MSDRDADWLLGLAKLRASQIIKLVEMFEKREIGPNAMSDAVIHEARAILNDQRST